ncbi:hypothetical protein [Caulobacter sp. Root343]|uniref:hypothetical protein n=1 Tax=Caulobacter sp. Root343 TaxID=1736520 RepID=UPI001910F4F8|nr:hypothetical protein [Caulobacter sp. Root343]
MLADFEAAATALLGMPSRVFEARYGASTFWRRLAKADNFYGELPLMLDARVLHEAVAHLDPTILTGCPRGGWAEAQKESWARRNFPGVPIITCMAVNKRAHCQPGDVLIDDTLKHRHLWEEARGVFIHHRSAAESLAALASAWPTANILHGNVTSHVLRSTIRQST